MDDKLENILYAKESNKISPRRNLIQKIMANNKGPYHNRLYIILPQEFIVLFEKGKELN